MSTIDGLPVCMPLSFNLHPINEHLIYTGNLIQGTQLTFATKTPAMFLLSPHS